MKIKKRKYTVKFIPHDRKIEKRSFVWAESEDDALSVFNKDRINTPKWAKVELTKTVELYAPEPRFINSAQEIAFFDVLDENPVRLYDVYLYNYCNNIVQKKIQDFHNALSYHSVLLESSFQSDIFSIPEDTIKRRMRNKYI